MKKKQNPGKIRNRGVAKGLLFRCFAKGLILTSRQGERDA